MKMKMRKPPTLSKSRFLAGLQCHLRLWHQCYNRDLVSEISPAQQALFNTGHEVGELATLRYPEGVLIKEDHFHHEKAVLTTLAVMKNPAISAIYEAAFIYDGVRIRVDILERPGNDGWNLIEVKSSTSVKDVYLPDVAVQYHVLRGSGLDINRVFLMHVNNQYVFDGQKLDLAPFFSLDDLTDQVMLYESQVSSRLVELNDMLRRYNPPNIRPSKHCMNPYKCEFWEHCTSEMPEFWVMDLSGITQDKFEQLVESSVEDISEIPDGFPLTALQERIKKCVADNQEYTAPELKSELLNVGYPVHFLDFETVSPVIPHYAGTRPYQTIPFQWSDHILSADGALQHKEYLCVDNKDPREEFVETLLDILGREGTIFIYTTYEKGIVNQLADLFPHFQDQLLDLFNRFKDLHALIRTHYYHPEFYGSFSLKAVLPVLVPTMNHGDLAIQEGSIASLEYLRMLDPATSADEKGKIKIDLLTYCGYDTLSMVKIRDELLEWSGKFF